LNVTSEAAYEIDDPTSHCHHR